MKTQDRVLAYLRESRINWVSGEWLSQEMSMSRAAVNKHVHHLQQLGYPIETSTKKGYRIGVIPDLLLPNEIRAGLDTKIFGIQDILYFSETDSTNRQAGIIATAGAPEGAMVIADKQSQGKGRKGRDWFSPEGVGVYLSLILRPSMSPAEASVITLMTGVAAAEALIAETGLDARIKWPNDILVKGRKLAGILTELNTEMDRIGYVIVGIGMNVNIPLEDFHAQIQSRATSILAETGVIHSRGRIVQAFLKSFEGCYNTLLTEGFEPIRKRWKELSDIIDRQIRVEMIGKVITGEAVDIDREGVLILKDKNGGFHRIISGDVEFVRD